MADVNGDGLVDFVGTYYYDGSLKVETYINQGNHADILSQITTAQGGTIGFTYKSSLEYKGTDGKILNKEMPAPVVTVHTITKNDGFGTPATETRDYAGASYYHNGAEDRFFAGFQIASTTDGAGNQAITYFHTGSSTDSALGEYDDHISKKGKPFRIEQYDSAGNLYSKTLNKWERYDQGDGRNFVKLTQSITFSYDGDSDHKDKAETYGWNDESRNLSDKAEWGEVSGSDDGTFVDVGSDKRTTVFSYATSTDVTGLVAQESTSDYTGAMVKDIIHYYDSLSFGNISKGNETKQENWVSDVSYIDFEKTYNSYGLVTQEKDPRDKATNFIYDWRNLYQATTTNPTGHITERYFDYSSGKTEKTVDPNGRVFETTYDGLDRVTAEKIPDVDAPSTLVTKKTIAYTDTVGSRSTLETDYLNAATSTETYTYLDGFDRTIQTRKEAEESNTYAVRDFEYNLLGLLSRESLPYFGTGSSRAASTTASAFYATYTYDALKRLTKEENAVGSTTKSYDDWTGTTTDALSNAKDFTSDAFGNLTTVNEYDSGSVYRTSYDYNARNDLTKITDSLGNIRNFTYDALSRLTNSEDLHDSGDTGFASTTYAYDAAGNITGKLDGKNQSITYTYDDINRVLTEDYADEAGTEIAYGYDACTDGIGRLCAATTTDAVANFAYNALGNIATETKTIDGTLYATTYAYDRQGNTAHLTYSDSGTVEYRYNSAGLLESVETLPTSTSTLSSLTVSNLNYGPTGQVTAKVFGNGDVSLYAYDANALYRLTNIATLHATTTPFDGTNPAVTVGATNPQKDGAELIGNLIDMMGESNITLGFRYGLLLDDDDPWTATTTTLTASSTGPFSVSLLGLDPFKDYSYQVFMSTSSSAVYYGDRYRFYTADLTMSMPVYKEHQRAWVLHTYDDFGTHASTTAGTPNASGLARFLTLENFGSTSTPQYENGYWLSDPWDLSPITNVEGSFIEYCACARNGADVVVKTAITTSTSTEPSASDFTVATTTTTIPGITAGANLYGKFLWLKIELEPNTAATGTPCLCRINLAINNVGTTTSAYNALQDITYTYDAVGNITSIADLSGFGGGKTVNYTYDDLYRLTSASTTVPADGGYNQTFSYDRIGNIVTAPSGTYTYAETNYANPSAATSIGGTSLTYDDNGNVAGYGSDAYSWNYRDRLTKSIVGANTTFYGYDFNNDRVTKGNGVATTTFANKYYNVLGATTTKHVYDNAGTLLATIEGNGEATSTLFAHSDHLGSVTVSVDEDGDVVESSDFYPFGGLRVNTTETGFIEQRKHTGNEYDSESNLTYGEARYRNQDVGKWFSVDPAVLNLITDKHRDAVLNDPQLQNSYSYSRNSPLVLKDESGEFAVIPAFMIGGAVANVGAQAIQDIIRGQVSSPQEYIGAAVGGAAGGFTLATGFGISAAGGVTGGVSDAVTQSLLVAAGRQDRISATRIIVRTIEGVALSKVPVPGLQRVTKGANSYSAIMKQILTKYENGLIQNIAPQTLLKTNVSQGVWAVPEGVMRGLMSNPQVQGLIPGITEHLQQNNSSKKEETRGP
ncbi:MAG: hypothetical protein HYY60_03500 [Parcubacteria group bacterium]|nr:hypothetical protein [Parcubacteria group bacterium]